MARGGPCGECKARRVVSARHVVWQCRAEPPGMGMGRRAQAGGAMAEISAHPSMSASMAQRAGKMLAEHLSPAVGSASLLARGHGMSAPGRPGVGQRRGRLAPGSPSGPGRVGLVAPGLLTDRGSRMGDASGVPGRDWGV